MSPVDSKVFCACAMQMEMQVPEDLVQITGNALVLHCCEAFAKINTGW